MLFFLPALRKLRWLTFSPATSAAPLWVWAERAKPRMLGFSLHDFSGYFYCVLVIPRVDLFKSRGAIIFSLILMVVAGQPVFVDEVGGLWGVG